MGSRIPVPVGEPLGPSSLRILCPRARAPTHEPPGHFLLLWLDCCGNAIHPSYNNAFARPPLILTLFAIPISVSSLIRLSVPVSSLLA